MATRNRCNASRPGKSTSSPDRRLDAQFIALERQLANLIGSVNRNVVPQRLTRLQANVFRIDRALEVVDVVEGRVVRMVVRACHINRVVGHRNRARVHKARHGPCKPYAGVVTPSDATGRKPADLPELRNTIVVAAFEGWNDAGDAASDALEHLDAIWEAEPIIEIDDEAYYDYQVNRPVIRQIDGVTRELVWPSMRISHCRPPGSDRDIVLMHGVEPNMRWRTFCAELLAIADKLNVDTVVILGALLADTPHTRPVPVSGAAYSPDSAKFFGLEETRYEGPTGIAGVFQDACVAAGIPAVTFWAAVPHYVSQPPNPKATVALLRRVEDVLDIEVPLADLPHAGRGVGGGGQRDDRRGRRDRRVRRSPSSSAAMPRST